MMEAPVTGVSIQVCDRCRKKKIKCDGVLPKCGKCTAAGAPCLVTAQLRRKTTPRAYRELIPEHIDRLSLELARSQEELQRVSTSEQDLRDELQRTRDELEALHLSRAETAHTTPPSFDLLSKEQALEFNQNMINDEWLQSKPDPVLTHVGRPVLNELGIQHFAGSSTGVHFVLCAQKQYQRVFRTTKKFPEIMFNCHTLFVKSLPGLSAPESRLDAVEAAIGLATLEPSICYAESEKYFSGWPKLYPILTKTQFYDSLRYLLDHVFRGKSSHVDVPFIFQLYAIFALNSFIDHSQASNSGLVSEATLEISVNYQCMLERLLPQISRRGDLLSLQGMLLYLLYAHATSQIVLASQLNAMTVRLAQLLGLHRNSRRFNYCAGEAEARTRVGWCVFVLDLMTSIKLGMPRLIRDVDMDIEMPSDVDFDDINAGELSYPLPGETTKYSLFVLYVQLAQILSSCLDQLYTTTQRRGAVNKMAHLQHELDSWKQRFFLHKDAREVMGNGVNGLLREEDPMSARFGRVRVGCELVLWLFLMGEVTCMLIHRPALSFDPSESQFRISLRQCVTAAANIILIGDKHRMESWMFHIWPCGCHYLLQSALVLLFSRWHNGPFPSRGSVSNASHGQSTGDAQSTEALDNVKCLVSVAIELLESRQRIFSLHGSAASLGETTSFLSHLAYVTFSEQSSNSSPSESTLIGSSDSMMLENVSEAPPVVEPMWHFDNPADQGKYSMVGTCYLGYDELSS